MFSNFVTICVPSLHVSLHLFRQLRVNEILDSARLGDCSEVVVTGAECGRIVATVWAMLAVL